jgi:hypothetical protein
MLWVHDTIVCNWVCGGCTHRHMHMAGTVPRDELLLGNLKKITGKIT